MKRTWLTPMAAAAGAAAFALWGWLLKTGVDARGLIRTDHPANLLLLLLGSGFLVAAALLTRPQPKAYAFSKTPFGFAGGLAGALGVLITGINALVTARTLPERGIGIFGILAAACLWGAALLRFRDRKPAYWLHGLFTVYCMLHILGQYRAWNTEPQLAAYLPQLLASIALMIAAYYRSCLEAGLQKGKGFAFWNSCAVFFCAMAIPGDPIFYGAMALWCGLACPTPAKEPAPMVLPETVRRLLEQLENAGFSAYVVGGCVRDHLLGLTPHDYDICTAATPEDICRLFAQYTLVTAGIKHGTVGVVVDDKVYEITTFRTEGNYSDNRHPDQVTFVTAIEEDLSRRDFTVNAMAYSPTRGFADPFEGQKDLAQKRLRAVGDAETRFREDALRILRGIRFAVRFGLTPEENTLAAMESCKNLIDNLAGERILSELTGMLPLMQEADFFTYRPILLQVIPELAPTVGFDQRNPHHLHDIYTHTVHAVTALPQDFPLRFAALLHDIGKVETFSVDEEGIGHFYGHAKASRDMAEKILARLKFPNLAKDQILMLIEQHMTLPEADKKYLRRLLGKYGQHNTELLLTLQKADLIATGTPRQEDLKKYEQIDALLEEIHRENSCLTVKDLAVNGSDLMAIGIPEGPHIGGCLALLLELVQSDEVSNEKQALLEAAQMYIKNELSQ